MTVKIPTVVLLVMMPCGVGGYKHFWGMYCLHLKGGMNSIFTEWPISPFVY
jgi:hypothetical protein